MSKVFTMQNATVAVVIVAVLEAVTLALMTVLSVAGKPPDGSLNDVSHVLLGLFVLLLGGRAVPVGAAVTQVRNGNGGNGNQTHN